MRNTKCPEVEFRLCLIILRDQLNLLRKGTFYSLFATISLQISSFTSYICCFNGSQQCTMLIMNKSKESFSKILRIVYILSLKISSYFSLTHISHSSSSVSKIISFHEALFGCILWVVDVSPFFLISWKTERRQNFTHVVTLKSLK